MAVLQNATIWKTRIPRGGGEHVELRKTTLRELDRYSSDDELARIPRDLRPWFARPLVWFGAIGLFFVLLVFLSLFLRAAPV